LAKQAAICIFGIMLWIYLIFAIDIDPMERLLLINFEKDPDSLYIGFEPQVFDDDSNGKGHLVIGWRTDGRVDVYHQPTLTLDPGKYDIAGKGLAHMIATDMEEAFYEVNDFGVQAAYRFKDLQGRQVDIRIAEKNERKRKPFGLLAPMGDAAESPSSMPLVLLHDFYFARKKNTDFSVSIDGKKHAPDLMPMRMDGARMLFTRYSPRPIIANFNPAFNGELPRLHVEQGVAQRTASAYTFEFEWNGAAARLKSMTRNNPVHSVRLGFEPAFPTQDEFSENNFSQKGNFEIQGDPSTGKIRGEYQIRNENGKVFVSLVPSGGWIPRPDKFSLRFLYTVAKVFKKWPTTYLWSAELEKTNDGAWNMKSNWKRTGKIM
jgi:hypothetical protein